MKTIEVTVKHHWLWDAVTMHIPRSGTHSFARRVFERLTGIKVNGRARIRISFARARRKPRKGRG